MKFNLKLGLQIPTFNNLNEFKNRTPLLPFIIRPLVYETSFGEFLALKDFVPARAFVQAYGFLPAGETKFDYAVYLGNSPNINTEPTRGQTGVDTTTAFLVGGRLGIRYGELKLGLSATYDKTNGLADLADTLHRRPAELQELPFTRLGETDRIIGQIFHLKVNLSRLMSIRAARGDEFRGRIIEESRRHCRRHRLCQQSQGAQRRKNSPGNK
jgi:hypothetical protein